MNATAHTTTVTLLDHVRDFDAGTVAQATNFRPRVWQRFGHSDHHFTVADVTFADGQTLTMDTACFVRGDLSHMFDND